MIFFCILINTDELTDNLCIRTNINLWVIYITRVISLACQLKAKHGGYADPNYTSLSPLVCGFI